MEASAMTGECVEEVFIKCATTIINKIDSGELDPTSLSHVYEQIQPTERTTNKPTGCYC